MIIDISSYQGNINFNQVFQENDIERIILRSTIKNGDFDSKFLSNLHEIKKLKPDMKVDCYKFTYARNFNEASLEAFELVTMLKVSLADQYINTIWLDIEPVTGHVHDKSECAQIISAYALVLDQYGYQLGIYCNYTYAKTNIPEWAQIFPMWLARWNNELGQVPPFKPSIWQYTSEGSVAGIQGHVDLSRYV